MVNALETSKGFDEEQGTSLEVDGFGSKPLVLGWLVNSEMLALEGGTNSSSTFWYVPCIGYHLVSLVWVASAARRHFKGSRHACP
jgi:hypothetical protein